MIPYGGSRSSKQGYKGRKKEGSYREMGGSQDRGGKGSNPDKKDDPWFDKNKEIGRIAEEVRENPSILDLGGKGLKKRLAFFH
jgi:hypothetical protein